MLFQYLYTKLLMKKLHVSGQYSVEILQKKWRNLRDTFIRVKGDIEGYDRGLSKKKKTWKHYESMKFLQNQLRTRM